MKDMLEEYGGLIAVCFFTLLFLVMMISFVKKDGVMNRYITVQLEGTGTKKIEGETS